jgi:DNA polymerase III subunit delta
MSPATPVIYLLNGDDEFAIAEYLEEIVGKMGDPTLAELNTSRLDGRTYNLDELAQVTNAVPFLTRRRLVILTNPTVHLASDSARQKFCDTMDRIPETTALVLVENQVLTDRRRSINKEHWLEAWVNLHPERAMVKLFLLPRGPEMVRWIQAKAKEAGGQFTIPAAQQLVQLVGEEPRQMDQEIQKLLAYVNYKRPVELDDVQAVTADTAEGDIFQLVDAVGHRNSKQALAMLQRLLEEQDAITIFGMVVRQFRLLLQVREQMDEGRSPEQTAQAVHIHPFVAKKLTDQARTFTLITLESIYHHLLDLDQATKTGKLDGELALQTLIVDLAGVNPHP